jgi:hypothetical protein
MTPPPRPDWFTFQGGAVLWGSALVLWVLLVVIALLHGVASPPCDGERMYLYCVVKDNSAVVASVTAVLGVTWSWFLQMQLKKRELDLKERELDIKQEELNRKSPP